MKVIKALQVLQKGVALSNAKAWKTTATATAGVSAFLTALTSFAVAQGWFDGIDQQTIMELSSVLVTVVFTALSYLNVATDEDAGVKPNKREAPRANEVVNHFLGD